jgi:signal transduction histidine kinase
VVEIRDDGIGMAVGRPPGHGLIGIRERVALFGGWAETGPVAGGGFRVRAGLPIGGRS